MLDLGLYIVATPIGRMQDITLNALDILAAVDFVLCEDTRVTAKLLQHFNINTKTVAFHKFNEVKSISSVLEKIKNGAAVALVSDAGTPAIHDPGFKLVQEAQKNNIPIKAIPGASSLTAALSIAGCDADQFVFSGFLPSKKNELKTKLMQIKELTQTVVCFESTHRLKNTLNAMLEFIPGARSIVLCKELTKIHEQTFCLTIKDIPKLIDSINIKGEWVIIFKPYTHDLSELSNYATKMLELLIPVCGINNSVKITKEMTGESRSLLYEYASKLKDEN